MIKNKALAHLPATAVSFLGGVLGFGFAAVLITEAHGTALGIVLASGVYALLLKGVDQVLLRMSTDEQEWIDPLLLWFLTLVVSAVLIAPVSAIVAPQYEIHGVLA